MLVLVTFHNPPGSVACHAQGRASIECPADAPRYGVFGVEWGSTVFTPMATRVAQGWCRVIIFMVLRFPAVMVNHFYGRTIIFFPGNAPDIRSTTIFLSQVPNSSLFPYTTIVPSSSNRTHAPPDRHHIRIFESQVLNFLCCVVQNFTVPVIASAKTHQPVGLSADDPDQQNLSMVSIGQIDRSHQASAAQIHVVERSLVIECGGLSG